MKVVAFGRRAKSWGNNHRVETVAWHPLIQPCLWIKKHHCPSSNWVLAQPWRKSAYKRRPHMHCTGPVNSCGKTRGLKSLSLLERQGEGRWQDVYLGKAWETCVGVSNYTRLAPTPFSHSASQCSHVDSIEPFNTTIEPLHFNMDAVQRHCTQD